MSGLTFSDAFSNCGARLARGFTGARSAWHCSLGNSPPTLCGAGCFSPGAKVASRSLRSSIPLCCRESSQECRLIRRCRPAAAAFARFRRRVNSNVRRPDVG